jgi:hypothetical protein
VTGSYRILDLVTAAFPFTDADQNARKLKIQYIKRKGEGGVKGWVGLRNPRDIYGKGSYWNQGEGKKGSVLK